MSQFQIKDISIHILPMETRFPFKYGIASMTHLPHLFVSATIEVGANKTTGLASEGFPPKWFTKNPDTTFEEDLKSEINVIKSAVNVALQLGNNQSFFRFWIEFYQQFKKSWSKHNVPSLLANFALSLVERAALDAYLKAKKTTLHRAIYTNLLGIQFEEIHPELSKVSIEDFIKPSPISRCHIRHTVGLGDPLEDKDVKDSSRPDDELPFTLIENIRKYQLTYFKLKLSGNSNVDVPRLERIALLFNKEIGEGFRITLDGNEQFQDFNAFRSCWDLLLQNSRIEKMLLQNLILVEQPIHRSNALSPDTKNQLADWEKSPGVIIDEADGDLSDLPTALDLGYSGTSHKNCKGIIKGLINAAYLQYWNSHNSKAVILSGEDLANVGPIALLQDLAMMNTLGINHVERNGHHYFNGLNMIPNDLQKSVQSCHSDMYENQKSGIPSLRISNGMIETQSLNLAPFGSSVDIDPTQFQPLDEWINSTLTNLKN